MRLNALHPSDNPMEKLLYCFGGGDDNGGEADGPPGSGMGPTDVATTSGGSRASTASERGVGGGGGDRGFDAFDMSKSYVDQSIANFQSPSVGVMATPMQAATGQAGFSGGAPGIGGGRDGGDSDRNFFTSQVGAQVNAPVNAPSYPQAPDFSARPAREAAEDALLSELEAEKTLRESRAAAPNEPRIGIGSLIDNAPNVLGQDQDTGENQSAAIPGINVNIEGSPLAQQISEARSSALGPVAEITARPGYTPSSPSQRKGSNALFEEPMPSGVRREMRTPADIDVTYSPSNVLSPDTARAVDQSIDRAISDFAGYRIGRTQEMDDQGRITTEDFALSRDLVSQPPAFGGGYNPAEQLRMQEGAEALPAISVPDIDIFEGKKIPASILGRAASDLLSPASAVERALRGDFFSEGATPIPDQQGRIVGAVDESGNVYSISPFSDIVSGIKGELPPRMEEAYAQQRAIRAAERSENSDDGQLLLPGFPAEPGFPVEPVVPAEPDVPEEYEGRDIVGGPINYQTRGPISYSYTGLPSLAPAVLRPSFRARGSYSPLFPIG